MTQALDRVFSSVGQNLINQFGKSMVYVRKISGEYNPATSKAVNTDQRKAIKALQGQIRKNAGFREVKTGDVSITISASMLAVAPEPGDQVLINGVSWTVIEPLGTAAQDDVVLWEIQCRR